MSIDKLAHELGRIADGLPSPVLMRAVTDVRLASDLLAECAEGTSSDLLPQAVRHLDVARRRVHETLLLIQAAELAIRRCRQRVIEGIAPHDESAPPSTPPAASGGCRTSPRGTSDRAADILARLPLRTRASPKTSGYWFDDDGQEHGPVTSGRDEDYQTAVEELRALRLSPGRGTLFVTEHVEVKFAVQMRRTGTQRATLVINNTPCAPGRYSCDRLLPQILRPGQEVTVYWPGGARTYTGRRP